MNKIATIVLGIILVVGITLMLWNHYNTLSFQEITEDFLIDNESIDHVAIVSQDPFSQDSPKEALLDKAAFQHMVKSTSQNEFKKLNTSINTRYIFDMKTDQSNWYLVHVSEEGLLVNGKRYQAVGENKLIEYINNTDLDWK